MSQIVSDPIAVMKRSELKYLLNAGQTAWLKRRLQGRMQLDRFGLTTIASLYYDTPDHRLIRTSLEKPSFKEKLRLRSYGPATEESPVFLELKRKACGVVYKRRVQTTLSGVPAFFSGEAGSGQIAREITSFIRSYQPLVPACLILYDRCAYYEPGGDLRLTIDADPRYRCEQLRLDRSMEGVSLLPPGWTILELKVQDAVPLWLAEILSEGKIYQSSFSKYGEAYRQQLLPRAV